MPTKTTIVPLIMFAALLGAAGSYWYFRANTVNDAEDRRRWLREIDKANAESGFTKDTNGYLVYSGATNGQPASKEKAAAK
jgi:hypothetical protein